MTAQAKDKPASHPFLERFEAHIRESAGFTLASFLRQREKFGPQWAQEMDDLLQRFIAPDDDKLRAVVEGYTEFAIDGMRLQKKFEKTGKYEEKSYDQTSEEVYHNKDYMFSYYLPGLLLSHYLWPHHYNQLLFFRDAFLPKFLASERQEFADIGPGTGFYTRLLLQSSPQAKGWAFDISAPALEYCKLHMEAFDVAGRWTPQIRNVVTEKAERTFPFIVSVEVLEHLTDPVGFLKALHGMLEPGGYGYISAAMTAAEKDHIYLYNNSGEVAAQIEEAGFTIISYQDDKAYEPRGTEPVPVNVAFVVTRA